MTKKSFLKTSIIKKQKKLIAALLFILLFSALPVSSVRADIYIHAKTGIIFPYEIAAHTYKGKDVYDEKELGEAVSFRNETATATVYIYDYNRNDIIDNEEHALIKAELSNSFAVLRKLQEMGIYDNIKIDQKGRISGNSGKFVFISVPVTYNSVKDAKTGKKTPPEAIESMISIGIFRNHFIKIRYSFSRDKQTDINKTYEKRDAFIDDIRKLVLEVDLKEGIKKFISVYTKDPLSDEAEAALKFIVTYGRMSPLVIISLNYEKMPWLKQKDYPYSKELIGAYIVGQIDCQLTNNRFEPDEASAMNQVMQVYKLLRDKDDKAVIQAFEEELKKE